LPIVVMSALEREVVLEAINAGANEAVQKPMQLDSLLTLVKQILS